LEGGAHPQGWRVEVEMVVAGGTVADCDQEVFE